MWTHPPFTLLDFEATGLDPRKNEIIEIGAMRIENGEVVGRYSTLIEPSASNWILSPSISQLTGIWPDMLKGQPKLSQAVKDFQEFQKDSVLISHNAEFELGFLNQWIPLPADYPQKDWRCEDTMDVLALVFPELSSQSLDSYRILAAVNPEGAHRALKDCEDLWTIMKWARRELETRRPQISGWVEENLSDWWWNWFFALPAGNLAQKYRAPTISGDLKKLRAYDQDREVDWTLSPDPEVTQAHLEKANAAAGLTPRPSQVEMASAVALALQQGDQIAIEAPTGTGKSIGYLLPAVLSSRATGAPTVIATHSKNLQDQLIEKDLPKIQALLGESAPLNVTTLKGQENYLCLRKLNLEADRLRQEGTQEERWAVTMLLAVASVHPRFELDRLSRFLRRKSETLERVLDSARSQSKTTIGPGCSYFEQCQFFNGVRLAHQSDVLIANHALVMRWPSHYPKLRNIVFDEAHHLEDQLTDAFALRCSQWDLTEVIDADRKSPLTENRELMQSLNARAIQWSQNLRPFITRMAPEGGESQMVWEAFTPEARALLRDSLTNLLASVRALSEALSSQPASFSRSGDRIAHATQRLERLSETLTTFLADEVGDWLRIVLWSSNHHTWRIEVLPIGVSKIAKEFFSEIRGAVLTSATLSGGLPRAHVTERLGIPLSKPLIQLPSPYKLEEQATLFITKDTPIPGSNEHTLELAKFAEEAAIRLGGRTLILISSNKRLRQLADLLKPRLASQNITVFDTISDARAVQAFLDTPQAVLIGSERFGEGLDIPGPALSLVILEKINEAMTRSPLAEARKKKLQNAVFEYDFPLRMIWLKQRVGRLIRAVEDRGAVVVFDARYFNWSQGSRDRVIQAVTPMPVVPATPARILDEISRMDL